MMKPPKIKIISRNDSYDSDADASMVRFSLAPIKGVKGFFVGIDPGQVNMGIAAISEHWTHLWQVKMHKSVTIIDRLMLINIAVQEALTWDVVWPGEINGAVVENASFGSKFGQPALAEARSGAVLGLLNLGVPDKKIKLIVPSSIRKTVFGNGKQKAELVWPELAVKWPGSSTKHLDAASALACALAWRDE